MYILCIICIILFLSFVVLRGYLSWVVPKLHPLGSPHLDCLKIIFNTDSPIRPDDKKLSSSFDGFRTCKTFDYLDRKKRLCRRRPRRRRRRRRRHRHLPPLVPVPKWQTYTSLPRCPKIGGTHPTQFGRHDYTDNCIFLSTIDHCHPGWSWSLERVPGQL